MISIAVLFLLIGYQEWIYMRRDHEERRTIRIVMALGFVLLLSAEAIYLLKDRQSVGMIVNTVFAPVQQWLFAGT
jgi:membrane-anchored protein YejM (alkaline phosphatase superfamily)